MNASNAPQRQGSMTDIPLGASGVHGEGDVVIVPIPATVVNNEKDTGTTLPAGATVVSLGNASESAPNRRRGHTFLGCCCDTRRAVIIIDSILLVMAFISILASAAIPDSWLDDNEVDRHWRLYVIGYAIAGIVSLSTGIWGALRYKVWMIWVAGVWHVIMAIIDLVSVSLIGLILSGIFAYPHFVLASEIRRGIMEPETYKQREEHSCCCV